VFQTRELYVNGIYIYVKIYFSCDEPFLRKSINSDLSFTLYNYRAGTNENEIIPKTSGVTAVPYLIEICHFDFEIGHVDRRMHSLYSLHRGTLY
jgi:hypothetical protein